MAAVSLTLALFVLWFLLGYAFLAVFPPGIRRQQAILLSPAIGVAVSLLPVVFLSRQGIPVGDFAKPVFVFFTIFIGLVWFWKRPRLPWAELWGFAAILALAIGLAAWPMTRYGFDWVSYANDDMANYALGASRFLNYGFHDKPDLDSLNAGRDYSVAYWFLYVDRAVRSAVELMLAWSWGSVGLNAHQIFMPFILALHLCVISATAGLAAGHSDSLKVPLVAAGLMATSPLTTYAMLAQLAGQVGGLTLLCASLALLCRPIPDGGLRSILQTNCAAAVVVSALSIWYIEAMPFLAAGWFVYAFVVWCKSRRIPLNLLYASLTVLVLVFIGLNTYIISVLGFLFEQFSGSVSGLREGVASFPYFRIPSGIPAFFGLIPIATPLDDPLQSLSIAIGLLAVAWVLLAMIGGLRAANPAAAVVLVMCCVSILLVLVEGNFGLFKLAMYAQPFVVVLVASRIGETVFRKRAAAVAMAILLVPILASQAHYVFASTGEVGGGFVETPKASSTRLNAEFAKEISADEHMPNKKLLFDTSNVVIAKLAALYTKGIPVLLPSRPFFDNIIGKVFFEFGETSQPEKFDLHAVQFGTIKNTFLAPVDLGVHLKSDIENLYLVSRGNDFSLFNKYTSLRNVVNVEPLASVRNHLVFIHSALGQSYYNADRRHISFYQLEKDPMVAGRGISSMGRYALFMILNPSPQPRLVIELTSTLVKQHDSILPTAIAHGVSEDRVGFIGRGAGRVVSPPMQPIQNNGVPYIMVDMDRTPKRFPYEATGLARLYGRGITLDSRLLTTFARGISLISSEQYTAFTPPTALSAFPSDLNNSHLEFSGIYEDGYISEESFFILAREATSISFRIAGLVPLIDDSDFRTVLTVKIGGAPAMRRELPLGEFSLDLPLLGRSIGKEKVEIQFSRTQRLPGDDGRPIAAKISFVGFE